MKSKRSKILLSFIMLVYAIVIGGLLAAIIEVPEARLSTILLSGTPATTTAAPALYSECDYLWDFESADILVDTIGGVDFTQGNGGSSATYVADKHTNAYGSGSVEFVNTNDQYLTLGDVNALDFIAEDFSLSFRFYSRDNLAETMLMTKYDGGSGDGYRSRIGWVATDNFFNADIADAWTWVSAPSSPDGDLDTAEWYTATIAVDYIASNDTDIYIWLSSECVAGDCTSDGEPCSCCTAEDEGADCGFGGHWNGTVNELALDTGDVNTGGFDVGRAGTTATSSYMDGYIDEFAIWTGKVLNATEAEEYYLGTASGGWRE